MTNSADPEHFRTTTTPMLSARNAANAIEFYQKAFGATETTRLTDESGKISHAEIKVGDASIMISDEYPEIDVLSPESIGGSPVMILLQVEDVDMRFSQAVAAGTTVARPVADTINGAFGTGNWWIPLGIAG